MLSYSITLPTIGPKLQPSTTVHALILANNATAAASSEKITQIIANKTPPIVCISDNRRFLAYDKY